MTGFTPCVETGFRVRPEISRDCDGARIGQRKGVGGSEVFGRTLNAIQ